MRTTTRWAAAALAAFALLGAGAACSSDDTTTTSGTSASSSKSVSDASADELEQWQKDLNAVGCWSGAVDGEMGPETEEAIKEFQEAEGLTVDGELGPDTESALTKAVDAGETVCKSSTGTTAKSDGSGCETGVVSECGQEDALEEDVARYYTSVVEKCEPTTGTTFAVGPTSSTEVSVESFVEATSGSGTAGQPDLPTLGWDATFTDGTWDIEWSDCPN